MWYKDEADHSYTHYADSADLYRWKHMGVATDDQPEEGPNVFRLGGKYWMIADVWKGQGVYSSDDLTHWKRQPGDILAEPGLRKDDGSRGHHADVLVTGETAYIFYFVHPDEDMPAGDSYSAWPRSRSCIQAAMLKVENGCLKVIRDEDFEFELPENGGAAL